MQPFTRVGRVGKRKKANYSYRESPEARISNRAVLQLGVLGTGGMPVDCIAGRDVETCSECSSFESELQFPGRCWRVGRVDEDEETDHHRIAAEGD